jgi:glycosyltransferase involved in cell wall biosynthesis
MKIVQIGSYPLASKLIKGGIEASVYGLSNELAQMNKVYVLDIPRFTVYSDYEEKNKDLTIFRFSTKIENNFGSILRVNSQLKVVKKIKPDICHIHSTGFFMLIVYFLLKLNNIPTLVTIHGLAHIEKQILWKKSNTIRNFLKYFVHSLGEFIFLSVCPLFVVDTKYVCDSIKKYKKVGKIVREPKCIIIPQGVDSIFFNLSIVEKNVDLLSVGSLVARKGYLTLIDAIVEVKKVFPNIKLIILGTLSDVNYYQQIVKKIKEFQLENNVNIYPDEKFENVLNFYQRANVFVLHTREESQGIVFCEAMAVGLPIVATTVGGVPDIIENGINGLLSPFGDVIDFSNNIIRLLSDKKLTSKFEISNRFNAQKYKWSRIANETVKVYESLKIT